LSLHFLWINDLYYDEIMIDYPKIFSFSSLANPNFYYESVAN